MSFPLIGCDRLRESISSLIASGRMPHAIILEGEAGTVLVTPWTEMDEETSEVS